jgi:2-oxoglutarate dehydrogenase E1 component
VEIERRRQAIRDELDAAQKAAAGMDRKPKIATLPPYWDDFHGGDWRPEEEMDTGVETGDLERVAAALTSTPEGFHVHPKIERLLEGRREMGRGERPLDFGMAEALAFGTLLDQGVPVRLAGQDSRRGTFSHRHSVLIDIEDGTEHCPLETVAQSGPEGTWFEAYDTMLSEAAVLGFEFGFARDYPEALVAWEAQFGDFANGAQVIVDQFVVAAEDKWGLLAGLVMLLPHGYEGQGPEHSSARIERFLTLSAEHNIQVCQPSTAAQYFHLLRRQALRRWKKPLVVFTPKSMLRHKASSSERSELFRPRFRNVLSDGGVDGAERVLVCTGKVGHELAAERERRGDDSTAVVFVEQLYPFPDDELAAALDAHPGAKHIVWVQEEPANMGALSFVMPHLERHARGRKVRSVKRSASGSPATGSAKAHALEQKTLLTLAFEIR